MRRTDFHCALALAEVPACAILASSWIMGRLRAGAATMAPPRAQYRAPLFAARAVLSRVRLSPRKGFRGAAAAFTRAARGRASSPYLVPGSPHAILTE